jgi:hypothetical protein
MSLILMTRWPSHPIDCPGWEYNDHPDKKKVLPLRVAEVLRNLITKQLDTQQVALDTRGVHGHCFLGLTPPTCDYYAGHHRGEQFRCLLHYQVRVPSDPRVGFAPQSVKFAMGQLAAHLGSGLAALDQNVLLTEKQRLSYLVALSAVAFELFLRIHPYANGNGHAARFLVWSALGRYGHWPRNWPVDPQPPPPYIAAITQYRNGNKEALESYLLSTLTGP